MPMKIKGLFSGDSYLETQSLDQSAFSNFGTVIENPAPHLVPSRDVNKAQLPASAVQANQGSAFKYLDVTIMKDLYSTAPSKKHAPAVMNMFVCAPRQLSPDPNPELEGLFHIKILERHPYTTQTFVPLGLSPKDAPQARYLVIVAPSLPPSPLDEDLPVPLSQAPNNSVPGRGLPDLQNIRAFIATGSQAVTYGAGTWHAPMAVIGNRSVDFVVVQFANGVAIEDCQEVEWDNKAGRNIFVAVPKFEAEPSQESSKL